ncbi:DNA mismatch repair protein MutS core [Penicillium angulare]|uniref:DNA mismatch repair protein MutS core n=1 Tax=Penicillium angulare TaxID=116970 RepID=UPI0025419C37|nr:DNA mismatch repair protein MutS core [Penicillium angulare]KAJ5291761.1 DNA mismatch repair protein MutS core [Penicillium angulare]
MSSSKRKRTFNPPPITPRTSKLRRNFDAQAISEPPYSQKTSAPRSSHSTARQLRTPFQTETHPEGDQPDSIPDDDLGHVIAAVDLKDYGTVGCAYYSAEDEKVYLLGDSRSGGMETIDALITQIKPTVILTPPRVDLTSIQGEKQSLAQGNDSSSYLPYQEDVCPTQDFSYSNAKKRLIALDVSSSHEDRLRFFVPHSGLTGPEEVDPDNMGFTLHEGRLLHISSAIDIENPVTIGCVGAILTYLQKRRAISTSLEHVDSCAFRVRSLEMFSLKDTMWINTNALLSLQIIQSEFHPNMFNQGPGKRSSSEKEGLSVFGLFRRFSSTPQGRAKLKQLFFRPSLDLDVIRERHDLIGIFSRPDNMATLEKMTKALKHIKNLRPVMTNLHKGISTGSGKTTGFKSTVWETLLAFAFYAIDIHVAMQELSGAEQLQLGPKAFRVFEAAQLHRVGRMIQEIVDIDNSEEQGRTVVKQGLDRDLDRMKDRYDGLDSLLKHVAIEIAEAIPEDLGIDVNVIYFPQLGFNIAIPLNDRGESAYCGVHGDWELVFITETRAYFKDFRMRELDEKLGDIYGLICEREIEMVYDLAQKMLQYEHVLIEASDICGEIDCHLALAHAASFHKLIRPRMIPDNLIKIKDGRHLLQELTVSSYVPNDTLLVGGIQDSDTANLSDESPSMLILTGPNYSGKSVYMKQVALIVYLAQIGSFVPAESAELGITDKILTKINTQESVSKFQSTFMSDLQQISLCLKQVTGRSLVLIDEFGKGTNESDGIGLACGIFEHLLSLEDSPKVLAATHFHEIFENDFLALRPRLQLGHMEVKVCEESQNFEDQVTYLYNFRKGRSNKSFGAVCAAINGIETSIVSRANEIATLAARGENLIAACTAITPEEMEALQNADSLARKFLEIDLTKGEGPQRDAKTILEELLNFTD